MKRVLFASAAQAATLAATLAAALAVAGPAAAADLPQYSEPVAPVAIAPAAFNWTGFYAGVSVGGAFDAHYPNNFGGGFGSDAGVTAGGQVGYNYQFDPLVVGIEGDIEYTDLEKSRFGDRASLDYKASITPRLGYAFGQFLPYVKGGVAFGNETIRTPFGKDDSTLVGWTVGGGLEYAFTPNITAKVEYDYSDLGRDTFNVPGPVKAGFDTSEVKVGVNYKF